MITKHVSIKMTGANPSKLPDGAGDLVYEQDRIRDFAFLTDRVGVLGSDLFLSDFTRGRPCGGWIVTDDGSHAAVNVSAGYGYAPVSVSLGQDGDVPPATADEVALMRVASPALTSQGALAGTATYYVKMRYADVDSTTRVRAKAGGTWPFLQEASYALTVNTVAPASGDILLATVGVTAGAISSINQNAYETPGGEYDLIIDSDAKLDAWVRATLGQFKRVLIKSGTWTASALGPTAGVLINLDATGTTYVFGEKGSSIVYSGAYAGTMRGIHHASIATDMSLERFEGVKLTITNTSSACRGFSNCTNLFGCYGVTTCSGGGVGYGFYGCTNLHNCVGTGNSPGGNGSGFSTCAQLFNCIGLGTGSADSGGFDTCTSLIGCMGTGTSPSAMGFGFISCIGVMICAGVGVGTTGYGFRSCKKMQQNKALSASTTATYNTSYADAGTSNACADTAAGGYNS